MFYELNKANDRSDSVAEDLAEAREQSRRYKGEIRELNRRIDELAAQNAALAARDPAPAPDPAPAMAPGGGGILLVRSLAVPLHLWEALKVYGPLRSPLGVSATRADVLNDTKRPCVLP